MTTHHHHHHHHYLLLLLIIVTTTSRMGWALDCYVCKNQEDNKGKCVKTVKTCDMGQDRCLTELRWGGMPYWAPSGEKQYYISKRCTSQENCTAAKNAVAHRCDRIWYNDWECVECCHGDRCNFYVTLASTSIRPNLVTFLSFSTIAFVLRQFLA